MFKPEFHSCSSSVSSVSFLFPFTHTHEQMNLHCTHKYAASMLNMFGKWISLIAHITWCVSCEVKGCKQQKRNGKEVEDIKNGKECAYVCVCVHKMAKRKYIVSRCLFRYYTPMLCVCALFIVCPSGLWVRRLIFILLKIFNTSLRQRYNMWPGHCALI